MVNRDGVCDIFKTYSRKVNKGISKRNTKEHVAKYYRKYQKWLLAQRSRYNKSILKRNVRIEKFWYFRIRNTLGSQNSAQQRGQSWTRLWYKKPDPRFLFFSTSSDPVSNPPRIDHAIGPAQRRSMNYLEPDPTLPVRTAGLIFSREKNYPAEQFCRGRPIGKQHAKTATPLADTGRPFLVFLFDFRIGRCNGRTWLPISGSLARVVPF